MQRPVQRERGVSTGVWGAGAAKGGVQLVTRRVRQRGVGHGAAKGPLFPPGNKGAVRNERSARATLTRFSCFLDEEKARTAAVAVARGAGRSMALKLSWH